MWLTNSKVSTWLCFKRNLHRFVPRTLKLSSEEDLQKTVAYSVPHAWQREMPSIVSAFVCSDTAALGPRARLPRLFCSLFGQH